MPRFLIHFDPALVEAKDYNSAVKEAVKLDPLVIAVQPQYDEPEAEDKTEE